MFELEWRILEVLGTHPSGGAWKCCGGEQGFIHLQRTGRGWDKTGRWLGFSVLDVDKRLTLFERPEGSDRD